MIRSQTLQQPFPEPKSDEIKKPDFKEKAQEENSSENNPKFNFANLNNDLGKLDK